MSHDDAIHNAPPAVLASLAGAADLQQSPQRAWSEQELTAILLHQLAASIDADLAEFMPERARQLAQLGLGGSGSTFAQVLFAPNPTRAMLEAVKEFGKSIYHERLAALPREIGKLIYFAALRAGQFRLGDALTQLDEQSLRQGYAWAAAQAWITPELRELFAFAASSTAPASDDEQGR
jgi:hypothetical protein